MSKLFNTLRDVLTPYANKINLHTEEIEEIQGDVSEVKADLDDNVNDLKSALGNIDLTELFELGGVYTDNGFVYTNTNARVRIKKEQRFRFRKGKKLD